MGVVEQDKAPKAEESGPVTSTQTPAPPSHGVKGASSYKAGRSMMAPPTKEQTKQGFRSRVGGWFKSAGSWVSDKYDKTTDAIGEGLYRAGRAAKDVQEAWSATDIDIDDGVYTLKTDLDEVMDLMPKKVQDRMTLNRHKEGANEVEVQMDRNTGVMTIRSKNLELMGMNYQGLRTGSVSVMGLHIRMTNHAGGIPFLDEGSLPGWVPYQDATDNMSVTIDAERAVARNVRYQPAAGGAPIRLQALELGQLHVDATNPGGGVPFSDDKKDHVEARFKVGEAVLKGLTGADLSATTMTVKDFEVAVDQDSESGHIAASGISATGAELSGNRLSSVSMGAVHADITNKGGGLPMVDAIPDQISAQVTVGGVALKDLRTEDGEKVASGEAKDLSLGLDHSTGVVTTSAASLSTTGFDTKDVDMASADVSGFSSTYSRTAGTEISAKKAHVKGLDTKSFDATSVETTGLQTTFDKEGNTSFSANEATVAGMDTKGVDADYLHTKDLKVDVPDEGGFGVSATEAHAKGLEGKGYGAGDVKASEVSVDVRDGNTAVGIGDAEMVDFNTSGMTAKTAGVSDLEVRAGKGDLGISAQSAHGTGIEAGDVDVDSAQGTGILATVHDGDVAVDLDTAAGKGIKGDGVSIDSASATGTSVRTKDDELAAKVASAKARGIHSDHGNVSTLEASGFSASKTKTGGSAQLDSVSATGIDTGSARVSSVEASGFSASKTKTGGSAQLDSVSATGIDTGSARVSSVEASGFSASRGEGGFSAQLGSTSATGIESSSGSVQAVKASGLVASKDSSGAMAGTVEHASLSGVKSKGLALDSVQLEMLQAAVKDEKVNLGLDEVKAAGIDLQTGKVDLKVPTASAERIQAVLDKARFASASVGALDVPTAQFALHERARNDGEAIPTPMAGTGATPTLNEGSVGGTAGATSGVDIDTATVVRSLGARVDDVDADVRIPFKGGEYGEGLGSVGVKRGTVADLKLGVQDGRIVPDETKLDFNHHLDALLWIRGRGAYLTRDGKVKIDVGGWFDEDVTKDINKSLTGKKSKTIPLSTADLSAAVATKMERSEKEEQLAAAGAPHGTTAAAKKKPSSKDPKDLASAIQLDKLSGSASASFSPGKVELGGGNSFELGDAKNTATVEQQAGQDMVAKFVDFLLQSMSIKVGEHQVSGASASADEVQVRLEKDPSSKVHATGTVQGLRAEDVKVD